MTLRLTAEQAEELEAVAQVEERPIAEVVRDAIGMHIDARRRDAAFQRKLRATLARNKRILEKLSKR